MFNLIALIVLYIAYIVENVMYDNENSNTSAKVNHYSKLALYDILAIVNVICVVNWINF